MTIPITGQPVVPDLSDPDTFNTKSLNMFTWIMGSMLDQFNNVDPADFFAIPELFTNPVLTGSVTEDVFVVTGTTPALNPANGTIQTWELSGNSTPTSSIAAGQSILLMINDGTARTITWPSVTWVNGGGVAPALAATGYTVVSLWRVGATLYGALVGDGS